MAQLAAGNRAPAFTLTDQHGKKVKLSDFKGKKVVVYFYPKADTPGCTTQSCALRDAEPDLKKLKAVVLGISPDTPEKQAKFDDKYGLGFTLLADTEHAVAEKYGVWGEMPRTTALSFLRSGSASRSAHDCVVQPGVSAFG